MASLMPSKGSPCVCNTTVRIGTSDGDKAELAREKALAALDLMAVQDIYACPAPLAGGG